MDKKKDSSYADIIGRTFKVLQIILKLCGAKFLITFIVIIICLAVITGIWGKFLSLTKGISKEFASPVFIEDYEVKTELNKEMSERMTTELLNNKLSDIFAKKADDLEDLESLEIATLFQKKTYDFYFLLNVYSYLVSKNDEKSKTKVEDIYDMDKEELTNIDAEYYLITNNRYLGLIEPETLLKDDGYQQLDISFKFAIYEYNEYLTILNSIEDKDIKQDFQKIVEDIKKDIITNYQIQNETEFWNSPIYKNLINQVQTELASPQFRNAEGKPILRIFLSETSLISPYRAKIKYTQSWGVTTYSSTYPKSFHNGIDLASIRAERTPQNQLEEIINANTNYVGVALYSTCGSGEVVETGIHNEWGRYVLLHCVWVNPLTAETADIYPLYAHMYEIKVNQGTVVNHNTILGVEGTTGSSTGVHLHFSIYTEKKFMKNYFKVVNPADIQDLWASLSAQLTNTVPEYSTNSINPN